MTGALITVSTHVPTEDAVNPTDVQAPPAEGGWGWIPEFGWGYFPLPAPKAAEPPPVEPVKAGAAGEHHQAPGAPGAPAAGAHKA